MKTVKYISSKISLLIGVIVITMMSCERDLSDDAVLATFPVIAEVFTDAPVNLTDEFFISFDPAQGANPEGFGTDTNEAFLGSTSIRIDVPAPNDPDGGFIGGIFKDRGAGRDLSGFDALTFWAKGSTTATIGLFGFGTDFVADEFAVSTENVQLSTDWRKYTIPIPDASKLTQESGMFIFSAGTNSTNGLGYTFWMDEIRFENLGTIGQARPAIFNGNAETAQAFNGSTITVTGLIETFNLENGQDVTVNATANYFTFTSSNPGVAAVDDMGVVTVNSAGEAVITATLNGIDAAGSLTITSNGDLPPAPTPPAREPENVRSIFSDAYTPATGINFAPGFGGSSTVTTEITVNGDSFLTYATNNFTGILFDNTVDASNLDFLHVDVYTQSAATSFDIQIRDVGANGVIETDVFTGNPIGDDVDYRFTVNGLTANDWTSFDIPLAGNLAGQRNNLGALILVNGPDFILDNVYFYKEVIDPTPIVDDSAETQFMVPIGFESSTLNYNFFTFAGADSAIEPNPDTTGINGSANVMRSTKNVSAAVFAGTGFILEQPVDLSSSQKLRLKVWSPVANTTVRMALEQIGGANQVVVDSNIPVANEWVELQFDFGPVYNPAISYQQLVIFMDFGNVGDGTTTYFDDIKVLN